MTNSKRLATVRERLTRWLADQDSTSSPRGADDAQGNPIVSESILIREGFYCGRRFHLTSGRAVWFLEEDELKIYSDSGQLLCVLGSDQISEPAVDVEETDDTDNHVLRMPTADRPMVAEDDENETRRAA